jgi:hypothetical protein
MVCHFLKIIHNIYSKLEEVWQSLIVFVAWVGAWPRVSDLRKFFAIIGAQEER